MGTAVPTWPLSVAAEAAHVPEKTTSRWRNNKVITLHGNDVTTTGTGNPFGWSRERILQLAITQALVKKDVSPSAAARAGSVFSDNASAGREAGQLFPLGVTALFLSEGGAVVRNIDFSASSIFDLSNDCVELFVNLNRIVQQVDSVLTKHQRRT